MTDGEIQTALARVGAELDPEKLPMPSKPPVPCIPMNGVLEWEDWLAGRRWRREIGNRVAPEVIRRPESSADPRLRGLYGGERGLPFTPTEQLPGIPADARPDA